MTRAAVALLVLAAAIPARADAPHPRRPPIPAPPPSPPDDNARDQAEDANFDDDAPHHGFQAAAALGGAMQVGRVPESTGNGLGFSLRLGAKATRRVSLLFAIDTTTFLLTIKETSTMSNTAANTSALTSIGAQIYLRDALWVRVGGGIAAYSKRAHTNDQQQHLYSGPGVTVGAGVDVATWEHFAVAFELTIVGARYPEGSVVGGLLGLGVAYQ